MSKVQMIAGVSGTRDGADWPPSGGILECSQDEAAQLVAAGLARPVEKASQVAPVETATAKAPETATRKGMSKGSTGL